MQKRHPGTTSPYTRLLVYQLDAPLFEELADGRVGTDRLDELDHGLPHLEHGGYYTLILDLLRLAYQHAEVLPVEPGRSLDVSDRVAQMVDLLEQTLPPVVFNCRVRV